MYKIQVEHVLFLSFLFLLCWSNSNGEEQHTIMDYLSYISKNIGNYIFSRVNSTDITFKLWTRTLKNVSIPLDSKNLARIPIIPNKPIKVLIHGYTNNPSVGYIVNITRAYLINDDLNVIQVDWSKFSLDPYPIVTGLIKDIAKYIGKLIISMNASLNISYKSFHLIGSSFGAHIAGFAGKYVYNATGVRLGRITGLDPAAIFFSVASENDRLSRNDAQFVDVIHTDRYKSGISFSIGKADFYPANGEGPQPLCKKGNWYLIRDVLTGCSHSVVNSYFIESINSAQFVSSRCPVLSNVKMPPYQLYIFGLCSHKHTALLGDKCDPTARGDFYLKVNDKPPFARNGKL